VQECCGGQLAKVHERHVGGSMEGGGQKGNNWGGVEEDIKDPRQVPPDSLNKLVSDQHSLVHRHVTLPPGQLFHRRD